MRPLKNFNEYIIEGTARKQSPDNLLLSFVEKIGIDGNNANHIIKNAYDIIMELIRAKMYIDGFSTTGKGAHEAEVSYLAETGSVARTWNSQMNRGISVQEWHYVLWEKV